MKFKTSITFTVVGIFSASLESAVEEGSDIIYKEKEENALRERESS